MSQMLSHISREFVKEIGTRSRGIYELLIPPADIFEDGSDLVVVLDIAGFQKENIKMRLTESALTVSAKRDPVEKDGITYWEQRPLRIRKVIPLPAKVSTDEDIELTAKYENGVLTIRLPMKGIGKITVQ
ncbi:MAG: archaeal heat shock protein Hsp14 [Candidatus Parvarchaeota archaeon]